MGLSNEIRSVVTWNSPSVDMQGTVLAAIDKIANSGVSALIVKNGDKVVGIVTDMDLMGFIAKGNDLDGFTVSKIMTSCEVISDKTRTTPCIQLEESQSVQNAIKLMDVAGIHHLLVTGEKGTGIVSAQDLLRLVVG